MNTTGGECRPATDGWAGLEELREGLHAFLVRHCPDENDLDDVIQETFLRAARYRRHHHVQSLRPWAMRIALNVLADARRRVVRSQAGAVTTAEEDEPFDPPAPCPAAVADSSYRVARWWFDGETARELVLGTLGSLRPRDRELIDSFYGGAQSSRASALECGIPRHLVKVRLYRARRRLARALRHKVALESRWSALAS